jgi:hypothetical protein
MGDHGPTCVQNQLKSTQAIGAVRVHDHGQAPVGFIGRQIKPVFTHGWCFEFDKSVGRVRYGLRVRFKELGCRVGVGYV